MKAIKLLLAISIATLSFNASAEWLCVVHNAKGQTWDGKGPTRAAALGFAMEFCSENSEFAKNCVVDQCSEQ